MFNACATRFDVMENLIKFWVFFGVSKQGLTNLVNKLTNRLTAQRWRAWRNGVGGPGPTGPRTLRSMLMLAPCNNQQIRR